MGPYFGDIWAASRGPFNDSSVTHSVKARVEATHQAVPVVVAVVVKRVHGASKRAVKAVFVDGVGGQSMRWTRGWVVVVGRQGAWRPFSRGNIVEGERLRVW